MEKKDYTYVTLHDGCVKACSKAQAEDLSHCEDFFVITPEGNWLVNGDVQAVDRS